ncbi:hypothetical protein OSB04_026698 [Centaurea solstitialis]|uniref:Receptor-like serine/threonine-protein kinase n=1 Tax=Centaurea solstitialis TaxID=347529 RepID=A0AA38SVW9_9ASTR|nr:hypothetical protein OSB04_026698 [Centaurea solstitialis]
MTWIYYLFILITTSVASASATDTIFSNQTLKDGEFLVSAGGVFEFGFFGLGKSSFRYLGIRYKNIPIDNVVWVANRDAPLADHKGMLKLNGTLQLLNVSNILIWSSEPVANTSASNLVALQLLDSGNLVLKDDDDRSGKSVIWQSFDHPGNTWLPGMKLSYEPLTGRDINLTSWKSSDDPSPGPYTLSILGAENPQLFFTEEYSADNVQRIGYWNGMGFNGMTSLKPSSFNKFDFVPGWEEYYARYTLVNDSGGVLTRMLLKEDASVQQFVWMNRTQSWDLYMRTTSEDPCDAYDSCGPYAGCNFTKFEDGCQCLQGFEPKLQEEWSASDHSSGCKPENVTTSENGHYYFKKFSNMKLPSSWDSKSNLTMSLEECKNACNNATSNCTAYANMDIRGAGSGCRMWFGGLVDIRVALPRDNSGQDIYIRMPNPNPNPNPNTYIIRKCLSVSFAPISCYRTCLSYSFTHMTTTNAQIYFNSDIKPPRIKMHFHNSRTQLYQQNRGHPLGVEVPADEKKKKKKKLSLTVVLLPVSLALLLGVALGLYAWRSKKKSHLTGEAFLNEDQKQDVELPLFSLSEIVKATDNFSTNNKLGQGGFGAVYKGVLDDGGEIAVKRLSKTSSQGLVEFQNEVICIAKLQHRNLVKLLGYCVQGDEKMLVYEYMPNKSLDSFLFDKDSSLLLDWPQRYHIINGIARGLLYLHQDSRLRIIHRDLKASNILLDSNMNPKISDFGLARMFEEYETEGNTNKVVGTLGYISPEYATGGVFSVKSDVFSFGVLVLEIVSGKKNRGFFHQDHHHDTLLGHAWRLYKEDKLLELVDAALEDLWNVSEVLLSIHVGLSCVQQHPEERPSMWSVVHMLGGEGALPPPKQPRYFSDETESEVESTSLIIIPKLPVSINDVTITELGAR